LLQQNWCLGDVHMTGVCSVQLHELEAERRRLEDVNMQLLLKLENITLSMTTESSHVAGSNETSLFAELEMLSHSLSVDSFSNQPARPITIGTQVLLSLCIITTFFIIN